MGMHETELADGRRLHAYKHIQTRRYLPLADDGSASAYVSPDPPVDAALAPAEALDDASSA